MKLTDDKLGLCEIEIYVDGLSAVDSYISSGYRYKDSEWVELLISEMEYLTDKYAAEVQAYAYENGSRNHN